MLGWQVQDKIEKICAIYRHKVLSGRTRKVALAGRKCAPRIMYTLLGYELQLGPRRLTCPDLTTARYLAIFAELGLPSVEIPYDISRTARLLPKLEEAFQELKGALQEKGYPAGRLQAETRKTYGKIRKELQRTD